MKSQSMIQKLEVLPENLFAYADRNQGTVWQTVKGYQANLRQGTVGVKTRAMVKSTGKKPYKQKKTGNARRGSFVAPLHVGGGVAHGPKARDYREATPKKMMKLALGVALATRVRSGNVFVGELTVLSGKTKDAANILKSVIDLSAGRTLICLHQPTPETIRAFRNIRNVNLVGPEQVNAFHMLQTRNFIVSQDALHILTARLSSNGVMK